MGVHFPAIELNNVIWFSHLSRMSGFLWHSSKWACHFLQYTPGLEVLACSLNTNLNYVITMVQSVTFLEQLSKVVATFRGKIRQLFGCIFVDRYITPACISSKQIIEF